jgi:Tfp pilus assembly major pilin PilA
MTVDTNGVSLDQLVFSLRAVQPDTLAGIKLPSYPAMVRKISYVLAYSQASTLYKAIADDTLDTWLKQNPTWANSI